MNVRFRVCVLALLLLPAWAAAQMLSPQYGTMGAPMSNFLSTSYLTQRLVNDGAFKSPTRSGNQVVVSLSAPAMAAPLMPARLASHYPVAQRAQAEQLFSELLARYPQIEQRFSIPRNDLGGAVAAFLAGAYMAYRGEDVSDADFAVLARQIRQAMAGQKALAAASAEEKRAMYEQMAILGMFLSTTHLGLKAGEDEEKRAQLREAGRQYLEGFLKTDPARVHINGSGLRLG